MGFPDQKMQDRRPSEASGPKVMSGFSARDLEAGPERPSDAHPVSPDSLGGAAAFWG